MEIVETSKEDEITVDEKDKMEKGKPWARQKVRRDIIIYAMYYYKGWEKMETGNQ